jgi:hypothetical protein
MEVLREAHVPFLLGGAYAFCVYTGIGRHTKDFDLFVRPEDFDRALNAFRAVGYHAEKTFPHWLGKILEGDNSIDIIFRAGNGLCSVDQLWFERAPEAEVFGTKTKLCPPEEMIWMKAFIMERERYDGADVAHLFLHCAKEIDWNHLLARFGPDWRLLLSYLVLFGFIYPTKKGLLPERILSELLRRLSDESMPSGDPPLCCGTLLSRTQFLADVQGGGFQDARSMDRSKMNESDIASWTAAADPHVKPDPVARKD